MMLVVFAAGRPLMMSSGLSMSENLRFDDAAAWDLPDVCLLFRVIGLSYRDMIPAVMY